MSVLSLLFICSACCGCHIAKLTLAYIYIAQFLAIHCKSLVLQAPGAALRVGRALRTCGNGELIVDT